MWLHIPVSAGNASANPEPSSRLAVSTLTTKLKGCRRQNPVLSSLSTSVCQLPLMNRRLTWMTYLRRGDFMNVSFFNQTNKENVTPVMQLLSIHGLGVVSHAVTTVTGLHGLGVVSHEATWACYHMQAPRLPPNGFVSAWRHSLCCFGF